MAGDNSSKELGELVPSINLTEDQRSKLNNMAEIIENIDLKPISGKRLWRECHYLGGQHGVRDDKELRKLEMPPEIETVQKFINMLTEINFLNVKTLEANGDYNKSTFDAVKNMQIRINEYLAEKRIGVFVPPSVQEKKIMPTVITKVLSENEKLKNNLLNAKQDTYSTTVGKLRYEIKMGTSTETGRVGIVNVYDKNNNLLKKINISIDKTGKVAVKGTMLYQILVDGYVGVETLRAATAALKEMTKKELPVPTPVHVSFGVGYSFRNNLYEEMKTVKEILKDINPNEYNKQKKSIDKIELILANMTYAQEKALRENPIYIKVKGEQYSATWQGMIFAARNGVSYGDFLQAWLNYFKTNDNTKDLATEAENRLTMPKEMPKFCIVGKTGTGGTAVGVNLADVEELFNKAKENVEKGLSKGKMRDEIISDIDNKWKFVKEEILKIAKKQTTSSGLLNSLNKNDEIANHIYDVSVMYGNIPGSQSYLTMPFIDTRITDKDKLIGTVQNFINELKLSCGKDYVVSFFNDNFVSSFASLPIIGKPFRKKFEVDETYKMAESFVDKYVKSFGGTHFLEMHKMDKEVKAFAMLLCKSIDLQEKKIKKSEEKISITH